MTTEAEFGANNGAIKKTVLPRLKNIIFVLNETEPTNISQLVLKSGIPKRTLQRDLVLLKKKHLTAKGKTIALEMKKSNNIISE